MKTYVVCYDIEDDTERRKVARCLERYGVRVQKSVFEVSFYAQRANLEELQDALQRLVDDATSIRFYRITRNGQADSRYLDGTRIESPSSAVIFF